MRAKIKAITFDLDDTFWDIGPVIINAEIKTREWIESSLDEEIAWGDYESFMLLREDLIKKMSVWHMIWEHLEERVLSITLGMYSAMKNSSMILLNQLLKYFLI